MHKKMVYGMFLAAVLISAASAAAIEVKGHESDMEHQTLMTARIDLGQAINEALKKVPGKAVSAELDDEVSPPVYSVEVFDGGEEYEITLDPMTGNILRVQQDDADGDDDKDRG